MEPVTKRPRLTIDDTPESTIKPKETVEQTAEIFRLNDDCFEAIFRWLFTENLDVLSKTCVRIQNLVKIYFARIYPRKRIEIHRMSHRVGVKEYECMKDIIPNISFYGVRGQRRHNWIARNASDDSELIDYYLHSDCHKSPTAFRFRNMVLLRKEGQSLCNVLKNVQTVQFINCELDRPYADILIHCDNIRSLSVRLCSFKWDNRLWIKQHYPTLETFEIQLNVSWDHSELSEFFQLNPQIRRFFCRSRLSADLFKIQIVMDAVCRFAVQLEELFLTIGGQCDFIPIYIDLLSMSERDTLKRLSLEFSTADAKDIFIDNLNNLACLSKLYALHLTNIDIDRDLPNNIDVLANLKELHLNNVANSEYFARTIAAVTPRLELLVVRNACYFTPSVVCFIQPFIEFLPKLKKIVLAHDVWATINQRLADLNKIRQSLDGACTVFIWLQAPNNGLKEKPKIEGNTLIRMVPISDEYDHY